MNDAFDARDFAGTEERCGTLEMDGRHFVIRAVLQRARAIDYYLHVGQNRHPVLG